MPAVGGQVSWGLVGLGWPQLEGLSLLSACSHPAGEPRPCSDGGWQGSQRERPQQDPLEPWLRTNTSEHSLPPCSFGQSKWQGQRGFQGLGVVHRSPPEGRSCEVTLQSVWVQGRCNLGLLSLAGAGGEGEGGVAPAGLSTCRQRSPSAPRLSPQESSFLYIYIYIFILILFYF